MLVQDPPVAITENLWMLGSTAYPLYLFQSEGEMALFEGGIAAAAPLVCRQMEALGFDRGAVRQLLVTHAHPDHVMAVPALRAAFPRLAVVASEPAARTMAAEKAMAFFGQIDQTLSQALLQLGKIAELPAAAAGPIAVDRVVKDGDAVAIGGREFQVLATPGHSDCSLSFFAPRQGLLVVSDATGFFVPERETWWPNYFSDLGAYLDSIARLAKLDAEVACLSHNGAIRGREAVRDYFRAALAATEAYHARIVAEVQAGKPLRQLAEELGAEAHALAPVLPVDFFQKNCGLLIKQSLKRAGVSGA